MSNPAYINISDLNNQEEPLIKANPQWVGTRANYLLAINLIGAIFLIKFGIPVGDEAFIFFSFILLALNCIFGILTSTLVLRLGVSSLILMMCGFLVLTQLLGGSDFSPKSLTLLLLMHLPYIFCIKNGLSTQGIELRLFQKIYVFVSCLRYYSIF